MALYVYEFRVTGVVPQSALIEIEGMRIVTEPESPVTHRAQTVMRGPVPDQAALHGIMHRLQSIGLDLIEVRRLDPQTPRP